MDVTITSYRVITASDMVEVEFAVNLPTGTVAQTITATESALHALATARGAVTWDDSDIVALVGSTFRALADTVQSA